MSLKGKLEVLPFYNAMVRPWHFAQAFLAGVKNKWPAKKMRVIAVTGTNGKTTTCWMIWKMLSQAGYRTGLLTTVGWGGVSNAEALDERVTALASSASEAGMDGGGDATKLNAQVEHMTTERVGVLNERMRKIKEAGAEFLVLEVTSHALKQSRTLGVPVEIAVFTNLTHEHLDYHKTFRKYRAAKGRLFKKAKFGVINADDPNAEYYEKKYAPSDIFTYGIRQGDFRATEVELKTDGVEYACGDMKIKTQIPGEFNVYNSLAAVAVGRKLGLSDEQITEGIYALKNVEGRMNTVEMGQDFVVIVDYAHTPDALLNVLKAVKAEGRVIAVHGGAGRRDETTRAERGEILGKYADIVIITEDDSRDEDPQKIAQAFVEGAKKAGKVWGKNLYMVLDRREAIRKALEKARSGDTVLLLGKGHEKTILRADGPHDFEDRKVAEEILKELAGRKKPKKEREQKSDRNQEVGG